MCVVSYKEEEEEVEEEVNDLKKRMTRNEQPHIPRGRRVRRPIGRND